MPPPEYRGLIGSEKIIGESKPIVQLRETIEKYAKSDAIILITGGSGTGKELVAWNSHLKSRSKYENFICLITSSSISAMIWELLCQELILRRRKS
jgi:DNA-binding NtrC family response regulator